MTNSTTNRRVSQRQGRLTDAHIRNLQTPEKSRKVFDGNSLFLHLAPTGLRSWRFKYTFAGKEKLLPLGRYPEMSLAAAREARDETRKKIVQGLDPAVERHDTKMKISAARDDTFESVARTWHSLWSVKRHQRYAEDVLSRLEHDVFPVIGHKPIAQVTPPDVVRVMYRIQSRGAMELARRKRNTCSQIFRYAIAHGLCIRNPATEFKPADVLVERKVRNHPRIDERELPELLLKLEAYNGSPLTRLAIKLILLTFVRTSELIGAKWDEVDLERKEWRIPGERMKMGRTHVVPLSLQATEVFRALYVISSRFELVFPGERDSNRPMSNNTILLTKQDNHQLSKTTNSCKLCPQEAHMIEGIISFFTYLFDLFNRLPPKTQDQIVEAMVASMRGLFETYFDSGSSQGSEHPHGMSEDGATS